MKTKSPKDSLVLQWGVRTERSRGISNRDPVVQPKGLARPGPQPPRPDLLPARMRGGTAQASRGPIRGASTFLAFIQRKKKTSTKTIGGGLLSWDPYGVKNLVRYATSEEYEQWQEQGSYQNVKHKGSYKNAVWFFAPSTSYNPDFAEDRPWKVTFSITINTNTDLIHSESSGFKGEARHPDSIIIKENEKGAYGIGRNLIDNYTLTWTKNLKAKIKKK